MEKVKAFLRDYLWFDIFSIVAIGLMIASFLVPPTGVIDPSVLAGTGELFAFAALHVVLVAVLKGKKATVTKGSTTLTVGDDRPHHEHEFNN